MFNKQIIADLEDVYGHFASSINDVPVELEHHMDGRVEEQYLDVNTVGIVSAILTLAYAISDK